MRCIHFPSSLHSYLKHNQDLKARDWRWLYRNEAMRLDVMHRAKVPSFVHLRTKAITNSVVIGVTSPAKSGDITVLIQTSVLLLGMYFIANFVAPYFISKYYGFDKEKNANEEDTPS
ncbi:hypothetical protein SLE2022_397050 [Rubroshorea leprosula]|uniref:Uncharacterized protein n=1 Tax=Rubroshorea leprosula TaxID=152421 RepID=A0AAV5LQ86_9ROSI|nr:hypothetical protein SLEP1_g47328 [Rubroshorea leprosula]